MSLLPDLLPRDKQTGSHQLMRMHMNGLLCWAHRNPMGNLQFCKYKLLLYGKVWRRFSSDQNNIWTWTGVFLIYASTFPWKMKRFMKKLGSLPSRADEISLLFVSPKSNCLRKMAQNSRLWCQRELWIKTLQSVFSCPRIQHDTLPHRPAST